MVRHYTQSEFKDEMKGDYVLSIFQSDEVPKSPFFDLTYEITPVTERVNVPNNFYTSLRFEGLNKKTCKALASTICGCKIDREFNQVGATIEDLILGEGARTRAFTKK
jgi:hypothetical protein